MQAVDREATPLAPGLRPFSGEKTSEPCSFNLPPGEGFQDPSLGFFRYGDEGEVLPGIRPASSQESNV